MPVPPSAIASREHLALLRTRTPSGFRGVYYAASDQYGVPRYVAKVRCGGVLRCLPGSRSIDARVTATVLLAYYEKTFGPTWRDALQARKRRAWRVWHSPRRRGWLARLFLRGRPVEVTDPADPDSLAVFPTRDAALAGLDDACRRLTGSGFRRNPALWRCGPAIHTELPPVDDDWEPEPDPEPEPPLPPPPPPPPPEPRRPHPDCYKLCEQRDGSRTVTIFVRGCRVRVPGRFASTPDAVAAAKAFAVKVTAEPWPCRQSLWRYPPATGGQVPGSPVMMAACSTSPQH